MIHRIGLFVICAGLALGADLFRDDFSRWPAGWLSQPVGQLNAAIQEYHYLATRGVDIRPWFNPITHDDSWIVSDEGGRAYVEQHAINAKAVEYNPLLIVGDELWRDTTVEVKVKPLSFDHFCGVVFRYRTNRHYYLFGLYEGKTARLVIRQPYDKAFRTADWRELKRVDFPYDVKHYYALRVENDGPRVRAYIDGRLVLETSDRELTQGKAGIAANAPARFMEFAVTTAHANAARIEKDIAAREAELKRLQDANPKPVLWKKFETPGYGAGRNVRFGDLNGDGVPEMLIAQNIPRVRSDAFDQISCLTAVTLGGKVLWQLGKPDARNTMLTNDTPFQIHDIDGDGRNEVVMVRDFQLQILEGATGKQRTSVWMPRAAADNKERPYELNPGDAIAFLNLSGAKSRAEILVKDRYKYFWIYNSKLELLWQGDGLTGHYPYPYDADGDGKEEFMLGYTLWSHDGRRLWSHDTELKDHADGISMGNYSGDAKAQPMVYACGSDEGFLLFDREGKMLKHLRIGHAQSPSIARYRTDVVGLQLLTVNYWRNPGILSIFDAQGNLLKQAEPIHSGSPLLPVNWRGDGVEFAMLSANVREGGLIDGELRRVVMFPGDGHPDLAYAVLNLTGDARDEIVVWDSKSVWIYTQDRPFAGKRIYAPERNPDYNESNYRTTVSMPAWKPIE